MYYFAHDCSKDLLWLLDAVQITYAVQKYLTSAVAFSAPRNVCVKPISTNKRGFKISNIKTVIALLNEVT